MIKAEDGQSVSVHYVGTLEDGTEFDSSITRGEALSFTIGSGQLIPGFNDAVLGMAQGEKKTIVLDPPQAYGEVNPQMIQDVPKQQLPEDFEPEVGATIVGQNELGQQVMGKVNAFSDDSVTLDFNHPLSGKKLNFEIELVSFD